jgi:hypothetical protein
MTAEPPAWGGGLAELSRAPKNPANKVEETVKKRILKLKEKHKYWERIRY